MSAEGRLGDRRPAVSVVIIFLDEERFLAQAVDSVLAQTVDDWELLLVDDGSTDASTAIARRYEAEHPGRIRYVDHAGHANRGMAASRNRGNEAARGTFIASLDGDDMWRPDKLAHQLELLDRHPEAAMTFGPLLRWRSWNDGAEAAELDDLMGVGRRKFGRHPLAGRVVEPPALARLMLADDYFIPGGALIRRQALEAVGGYEETFRSLYEDAVVMLKLAVAFPVHVDDRVTYLYRMHPDSSTNRTSSSDDIDRHRATYLDWVQAHLTDQGAPDELYRALARARASTHRRRQRAHRVLAAARTAGRRTIPRSGRDALRRRWRRHTDPRRWIT
ncbi:MAG: glycosyltransferase family A protein [Actinomycetota bacterium]